MDDYTDKRFQFKSNSSYIGEINYKIGVIPKHKNTKAWRNNLLQVNNQNFTDCNVIFTIHKLN